MLIRARLSQDPLIRLFDSMFAPRMLDGEPAFGPGFPPLNVWEDDERVWCEAELPGVRMEDVELSVTPEELRLEGSRTLPEREHATVVRRERRVGAFERVVTLPVAVDVEHVEAHLRDGVLTVSMPKSPSVRARRIEVQGGASG